ncbi:AAA family ATPase [Adhaeretor mobilis]|uniref:Stage V sporulation protein K n=1 Tax=Adhaeretor mobilis TaxID=1930276 RepID=A0A517MY99_9BACT|nr:AAA family ATPase [Adhaeretor mobilis]QDS99833.1 Stage V sporulation protein K [Adhaeretor mobilis]
MSSFEFPDLPSQFRQLLGQCRDLYVSSGERAAREHAHLLPSPAESFVTLMDDLHRALAVKVFVTICEADRRWSKNEKFLAEVLLFHLWGQWLEEDALHEALADMSKRALELKWYATVRPFDELAPLRDRIGELETIVTRMANVIARADGPLKNSEAGRIKMIQNELQIHLREIPIDEAEAHEEKDRIGQQAIEKIYDVFDKLPKTLRKDSSADAQKLPGSAQQPSSPQQQGGVKVKAKQTLKPEAPKLTLEEALAELDKLIGLDTVKEEVRTLANFLKVQEKRVAAGLPTTKLSLHMVFHGNPGTGKTTVARIVGKVFGAMGVLAHGHLIETDRSGLVAEYSGQTGPKTNKKIDEALDGVLFIDEAYTLISGEGEDPFGHEAVQALLKRMEDDRKRLVVILAGYPVEMDSLLHSNPGLSSRFSRKLEFIDYTPLELAGIFGLMAGKNSYELGAVARAKVLLGMQYLYERRDRHFGNGRTSRNLFEHAIRRMANRIAEISQLSVEQLTTLEPDDIEFNRVPAEVFDPLDSEEGRKELRFHITCPECEHGKDIPLKFLGQNVKCPKCDHDFQADWGEPVESVKSPAEKTEHPEKSAENNAGQQ